VVVFQHATTPFSAFDSAHDRTIILIRLDEMVAQTLMVSLAMIMLNEVGNSSLKCHRVQRAEYAMAGAGAAC
jgi:hypothetical protein